MYVRVQDAIPGVNKVAGVKGRQTHQPSPALTQTKVVTPTIFISLLVMKGGFQNCYHRTSVDFS